MKHLSVVCGVKIDNYKSHRMSDPTKTFKSLFIHADIEPKIKGAKPTQIETTKDPDLHHHTVFARK